MDTQKMISQAFARVCALLALAVFSSTAFAIPIGNSQGTVEFPAGAVSFADSVVAYAPGSGGLTAANMDSSNALGTPDYSDGGACSNAADCSFVSLGAGGSIILQFIDNYLTGSNSSALDLWIFEVGPDVEDTIVDVSTNGVDWENVGSVGGSTSGIDLDAFGFGVGDLFSFVRLTDVAGEGGTSGASVGADIDAVGAISTIVANVPEPNTFFLFALGLTALVLTRKHI